MMDVIKMHSNTHICIKLSQFVSTHLNREKKGTIVLLFDSKVFLIFFSLHLLRSVVAMCSAQA